MLKYITKENIMNNYLVHFCGKIFFQMTSKPEGVKKKIYICYFKLSVFWQIT